MLKHIKLTTIRKLFVSSLILSCVILGIGAVVLERNISLIDDTWELYQTDRSEKSRLESALRAAIGYGGMIHEFKNLILRHDTTHMSTIHKHIGSAEAIIHQYSLLQLTSAELTALDDIQRVITTYEKAYVQVDDFFNQGYSITQLDDLLKINDESALRGLQTLRQEVRNTLTTDTPLSRARVSADLRAAIGYGGMIHEYKNYVLRHDLQYMINVQKKLQLAYKAIAQYRSLSPNNAEKLALNDIEITLQSYERNLPIITKLSSSQTSINEIDQAVSVDDYKALRGLKIIDQEVYRQIDEHNTAVSQALLSVEKTSSIIIWGIFSLLLVVFTFSVWLIQVKIIVPILSLTSSMKQLANNDISVKIINDNHDNELGEMTRSVIIFKENMIERHKTEMALEGANHKLNVQLNSIEKLREQSDQKTLKALSLAEGLAETRKSAERSTRRAEENELRVSSILNSVRDAIITINTQGIIESVNPATEEMFGYHSMELVGKNISILVPEPHRSLHDKYIENFVKHGSTRDVSKPIEQSAQQKNGTSFSIALHLNTIVLANEMKIIGVIKDVTERKQWEYEIKKLAMTDHLTSLANRHQYNQRLIEAAALSQRNKKPFALLILDLDKFKPVNDNYGHQVGDSLLKYVATTLIKCCRETDIIARLGGDEFAIILPSSPHKLDTDVLSQRIIAQLSQPTLIEGHSIQISISIGISIFPNFTDDLETLQGQADTALYQAKNSGRNTYCTFNKSTCNMHIDG